MSPRQSGYHHRDIRPPRNLASPIEARIAFVIVLAAGLWTVSNLPKMLDRQERAKVAAAQSDLRVLGDALDSYRLDVGKYPTTDQGLDSLFEAPPNQEAWRGPYLKKVIGKDRWGNAYVYRFVPKDGYRILSLGADGKEGGTGYAADLDESSTAVIESGTVADIKK